MRLRASPAVPPLLLLLWCLAASLYARGAAEGPVPATEIYRRIGPSLAFVETPIATGSGVVIDIGDERFVLTNTHVLWPYDSARLTFPGATELLDVPLFEQDLLGDIALLGPIPVDVDPLPLTPREDLPIGSDVYLVGYPLETEVFPTPTIAGGMLSRVRQWRLEGITFFQTDASIAGGQSGGVLVTDRCEVIGISGLAVQESYGLAASVADLLPRIDAMLEGTDVDRLGDRRLTGHVESRVHTVGLGGIWNTAALFSFEDSHAALQVSARSKEDVALYLLDAYGEEIATSDEYGPGGIETIRAHPFTSLRYVLAEPVAGWAGTVRLESSDPLMLIEDPDDGGEIGPGEAHTGHLDFPFDYDIYHIDLEAGDRITVTADSILIDPYLFIDREGEEFAVEDDDGGGGILGLNARITFLAATSGEHLIVVADSSGLLTGGYVVTVAPADEDERPMRFEDLQ